MMKFNRYRLKSSASSKAIVFGIIAIMPMAAFVPGWFYSMVKGSKIHDAASTHQQVTSLLAKPLVIKNIQNSTEVNGFFEDSKKILHIKDAVNMELNGDDVRVSNIISENNLMTDFMLDVNQWKIGFQGGIYYSSASAILCNALNSGKPATGFDPRVKGTYCFTEDSRNVAVYQPNTVVVDDKQGYLWQVEEGANNAMIGTLYKVSSEICADTITINNEEVNMSFSFGSEDTSFCVPAFSDEVEVSSMGSYIKGDTAVIGEKKGRSWVVIEVSL